MKEGIHPKYQSVVFRDASNGKAFLSRSTLTSDKTITWVDGNEYPLITLEISSTSHPFYTGTQRLLDTAGRVERFQQRYGIEESGGVQEAAEADAEEAVAEAGVAEEPAAEAVPEKKAAKSQAKRKSASKSKSKAKAKAEAKSEPAAETDAGESEDAAEGAAADPATDDESE